MMHGFANVKLTNSILIVRFTNLNTVTSYKISSEATRFFKLISRRDTPQWVGLLHAVPKETTLYILSYSPLDSTFLEIKILPFGKHLYPEKDQVYRRASSRIIMQICFFYSMTNHVAGSLTDMRISVNIRHSSTCTALSCIVTTYLW
jgi:hypothetical protein